ncbi:MAG: argininosuccinate lyase [Planctomycetia bacterium]|nr:MAG: argininosuccinate lyase [Planctomycetia bacterium]
MTAPIRLWDKGAPLDALVHSFTVGRDPISDLALVPHDCVASAAHARTLHRAGLLSTSDLDALLSGLREIHTAAGAGKFIISREQEDAHTAIEAALTARFGDAGRRIHAGRSRNDQVAAAMRLYLRTEVLRLDEHVSALIEAILTRIVADGAIPLPGYTHMQPAMPSSVGQWLAAHADALLDEFAASLDLLRRLDLCPLGTGAGFGVALPLDRAYTAKLLGFSRVQRSAPDVQNRRGRFELLVARLASDCGAIVEKLAWDILLYSAPEYGFLSLPESLTTGSSIMPQKRNPDVVELMRAQAARLRARPAELEWIIAKLPSSYHRDLQLTKEPVICAIREVEILLAVTRDVVLGLKLHPDRISTAMRPELYATDAAYELVRQGRPFRDAYLAVAQSLRDGTFCPPAQSTSTLRPDLVAPEQLAAMREELLSLRREAGKWAVRFAQAEQTVLHNPVS